MVTQVIRVAENILKRIIRLVGKRKDESWSAVLRKLAYAEGHETY